MLKTKNKQVYIVAGEEFDSIKEARIRELSLKLSELVKSKNFWVGEIQENLHVIISTLAPSAVEVLQKVATSPHLGELSEQAREALTELGFPN